jgi:sugar lactone lactonase YvrE
MGSADGTGSATSFREPRGIVVDRQSQIIVVDYMNHAAQAQPGRGGDHAGRPGWQRGATTRRQQRASRGPNGIAIDSAGNLYVADTGNRALRKITPAGVVSTAAVSPPGSAATARFNMPRGVAVDGSGQVYMADHGAHTLLKVSSTGVISTLAGSADSADSRDGSGSAARFFNPSGLAVDGLGNVVLADTSNHTVRRISPAGAATTVAGLAGRSSSVDGTGLAARFEDPYALAIDSSGQTWVADATDHSIRKVSASGVVTTVAGAAGQHGSADGAGSAARFFTPQGIAVDTQGNAYVADSGNATVRKISAAGVVSTLAGSPGLRGRTDGAGSQARFSEPYGVAVDRAGNVYVADTGNSNIRKITPAGVVSTLAGSGTPGLVDGIGLAAQFLVPFDLAVDADGNVYVCDHGSHAVREITPAGVVTTLAGGAGPGRDDGTGRAARFQFPSGIAVDAAGTVYRRHRQPSAAADQPGRRRHHVAGGQAWAGSTASAPQRSSSTPRTWRWTPPGSVGVAATMCCAWRAC